MKALLDTNVLVAASIRQHPHFLLAELVMKRCATGEVEGIVHAHSLLEFHSAVTQLPKGLAVPPRVVQQLLAGGVLPFVRCVALSATEVIEVESAAAKSGLVGGIIYDFYHLQVAISQAVDILLTFNVDHFRRLAPPEFREKIRSPGE